MLPEHPDLKDLFAPIDLSTWAAKLDLEALTRRTPEGFDLAPLYTPGGVHPVRGLHRSLFRRSAALSVCGVVHAPTVQEAAKAMRETVEGGGEQVELWLDPVAARGVGVGPGVPVRTQTDLRSLVEQAEGRTLRLAPGLATVPFSAWAQLGGVELELDPIGDQLRTGRPTDVAMAASMALKSHATLRVDGTVWHDAGADEATSLGLMLASGVAYLRASEQAAPAELIFRLPLTSRFLLGVATLRAARLTWARVLGASALDSPGLTVHAVPAPRMFTRREPVTNLLRITAAAFAALVGGADRFSSPSYDVLLGPGQAEARRITRNVPILLADEAHLGRVDDLGGGSYAIEAWTSELAERAWSVLQQVEAQGGMQAAVDKGWVAECVARCAADRADQIARRAPPIVGVSGWAHLEAPEPRAPWLVPPPVSWVPEPAAHAPLPQIRDAERFEALRDAADALSRPPQVACLAVGALPDHIRPLTWVTSMLAAGGFSPRQQTEAEVTDGGVLVVGKDCEALMERLRARGARPVWVGRDLREGDDVLAFLEGLMAEGRA
jgi:methylmalonyl-CoA mutase